MEWLDTVFNTLKDFFNQPVPIIGCTIGFLLVFVLKVLSSTTIGKKALNSLKKLYAELLAGYQQIEKDYNESKEKAENDKLELKQNYEDKITIVYEQYAQLEELILQIGATTPNLHVQEIVNEYKQNKQENKIEDISEVVEKEVAKIEKQYQEKYDALYEIVLYLQNQVENLTSLNEQVVKGDDNNGTQEQTEEKEL